LKIEDAVVMSSDKGAEAGCQMRARMSRSESRSGFEHERSLGGSHERIMECNINSEEHTNNEQST
jgi:hypothetical protein